MEKSEAQLSSLIEAMSRPEFYPDRPKTVEFIQTHISCVFLAGEFVYKVRKPVRFSFLDYSSLEKRHHFSQEEVRLNRRLAPGIYLGVLPILHRENGYVLGDESSHHDSSEVAEYAVKMRRLPEDRILEGLISRNQVGKREIAQIAARVAQFHAEASSERADSYGTSSSISKAVLGNLEECAACVGETLSRQEFERIGSFLRSFIAVNEPLFAQRVAQGRVREGHGDLRCEHICLTNDIVAFDCVEFSERLRYGDVASDLGFLAMDLDRLEASKLADELVAAYAEKTHDEQLAKLMRFYKCHRAMVRGKVSTLKNQEAEVPEAERARARESALTCFHLADRYAAGTAPALVVVCGLSGSGKSTVAEALAQRFGFENLNSDVVRKRMFQGEQIARTSGEYRAGMYDERSNQLTYDSLLAEAEKYLGHGEGVIVDATFKDPANRRRFVELARRCGVPVLFVECRTDENEIHRRLLSRQQQGNSISDATWEVYLRQKAEFVPITELEEQRHMVVDGNSDPAEAARKIEAELETLR
jgi:aminoglycoside phosphotransferase family enzyme/predicted kinase